MRWFIALLSLSFLFAACKARTAVAVPAVPAVAKATPAPSATPIPEPIDLKSQVVVLCYHRFEDEPKNSLGIKPADFEAQMQALKDNGITVISMADFLAWRRGEKGIPQKSAVISIDDRLPFRIQRGLADPQKIRLSFYNVHLHGLRKGGTEIRGQSLSWDQLAEMRDAGVNIESHTLSHPS